SQKENDGQYISFCLGYYRRAFQISVEGKAFQIKLNRPKKFNAITVDMYKGIMAALEASNKDRSTSITAPEISSVPEMTSVILRKLPLLVRKKLKEMAESAAQVLKQYIQAYIDHEKPLICLINGPAVGIAVTVLPLFDYVIATDRSTFHTPFSTLGQSPEGASSYTFPILMGQLRASEFLILNKKFSAHQALDAGLINEDCSVVKQHSSLPPESLRVNKMLLRSFHKEMLTKVNEIECKTICERWQSKECAAAIAAFLSRSKK
ncbi:enoyl-CoA hydratase/isomerase family protein, partial [Cooperia oncophora]